MKRILSDLWNGEPLFVLSVVRAILVIFTMLYLHLPPEQAVIVYGVVEAATSWYTRQNVSPAV